MKFIFGNYIYDVQNIDLERNTIDARISRDNFKVRSEIFKVFEDHPHENAFIDTCYRVDNAYCSWIQDDRNKGYVEAHFCFDKISLCNEKKN